MPPEPPKSQSNLPSPAREGNAPQPPRRTESESPSKGWPGQEPSPRRIRRVPRTLRGYAALSAWLETIGISYTVDALRSVAQSKGWPCERKGRDRVFRSRESRKWVEALTGYRYGYWAERWFDEGQGIALVQSRRAWLRNVPRPRSLFVALLRIRGQWQVARQVGGCVYATSSEREMRYWAMTVREYTDKVVEYRGSRPLRPEDLVVDPKANPIASLITVKAMRDGAMRDALVPGNVFGLEPDVDTVLIAPSGWPGWRDHKRRLDLLAPDARWTLWQRPLEYEKISLVPKGMRLAQGDRWTPPWGPADGGNPGSQ